MQIRAAARNKCPKIAQYMAPDSRRGKGRIARTMQPLPQRRSQGQRQARWDIYFLPQPLTVACFEDRFSRLETVNAYLLQPSAHFSGLLILGDTLLLFQNIRQYLKGGQGIG